jgi:hypothetical protein
MIRGDKDNQYGAASTLLISIVELKRLQSRVAANADGLDWGGERVCHGFALVGEPAAILPEVRMLAADVR